VLPGLNPTLPGVAWRCLALPGVAWRCLKIYGSRELLFFYEQLFQLRIKKLKTIFFIEDLYKKMNIKQRLNLIIQSQWPLSFTIHYRHIGQPIRI